ncbi:hypothetical protein M0657_010222 [Pyricularia oryzae]|nr:hypothetical protein M9X92_010242 [Pyricularia oryzae]KAI7912967.1 hypothetical protein M0657_010222 [Pyricularia oryzae]
MSLDVWNQNPNDFRLEEKDEAEGQMRMEGLYAICVHLVDQNPMVHFIGKIESVLGRWAILLTQTKMTCEILSTDRRVFAVLRALDKAITAQNGDKLLSRLAQVQLVRVLEALEARVAMERQNGHLHRRSGYRNASIVLDIYMSAQEMVPSISRRALIERKRVAKRWNELAGPWPLFLLVYSEEAEEIIQRRKPDNTMLRLIASLVLKESPLQLFKTCEHAAEAVEAATVAGRPLDPEVVKELHEIYQASLKNLAANFLTQ